MIVEFHRGHVRLQVEEKIITIGGEAYLPGWGSPDFVAYRNTIRAWDAPVSEPLTAAEIRLVEQTPMEEFKRMNRSLEIE